MFMKELVKRYEGNPLLTAGDLPGADAIFNAGAVKFNGKYLLLVSVSMPGAPSGRRGMQRLGNDNGFRPFSTPLFLMDGYLRTILFWLNLEAVKQSPSGM